MFENHLTLQPLAALLLIGTLAQAAALTNLRVAVTSPIATLDPAQVRDDEFSRNMVASVYETLFQFHYLKNPVTVEPLLAVSEPRINGKDLIYTIQIRADARFQDSPAFPDGRGRPVTAADFVYSWKRLADPRLKNPGYKYLAGKVRGLDSWRRNLLNGRGKFTDAVSGLETAKPNTLVVHLVHADRNWLNTLAHPSTSVVPWEAVEKWGKEFPRRPVGTGPFVLESWFAGNKIVLIRNPAWRGERYPVEGAPKDKEAGLLADSGKALPFVDKIEFFEFGRSETPTINFRRGALDIAFGTEKEDSKGGAGKEFVAQTWIENLKPDSFAPNLYKYLRVNTEKKRDLEARR